MKFRRTLRRDRVMRNLRILEASGFFDPVGASRAGPQLAQDEQTDREASPEGARQLPLF